MTVEASANPLAGNLAVQGGEELLAAFREAFGAEDPATAAAEQMYGEEGVVIETLERDDAQLVAEALKAAGDGEAATVIEGAIQAAAEPARVRPRTDDQPAEGPAEEPVGAVITMQGVILAQDTGENAIATFRQQAQLAGVKVEELDAVIVLHPRGRTDVPQTIRALLGATEAQGARPTGG